MERPLDLILALALILLLMRAVWRDLACRIISNRVNAAIAALAPLSWYAAGIPLWPDAAAQLGVALLILALFTGAFALGMMGGGDVKLLTALALWRVPLLPGELFFAPLIQLLVWMAIAGGILTIVMIVRHRMTRALGQPEVPYGVAIAVGALATYGQRYLYQFG